MWSPCASLPSPSCPRRGGAPALAPRRQVGPDARLTVDKCQRLFFNLPIACGLRRAPVVRRLRGTARQLARRHLFELHFPLRVVIRNLFQKLEAHVVTVLPRFICTEKLAFAVRRVSAPEAQERRALETIRTSLFLCYITGMARLFYGDKSKNLYLPIRPAEIPCLPCHTTGAHCSAPISTPHRTQGFTGCVLLATFRVLGCLRF